MHEVVILGSGAAGVATAYALKGRKVLLVDAGSTPRPTPTHPTNFYEMRRTSSSCFQEVIGDQFESLHNIDHDSLLPKLKSPGLRYVVSPPPGAGGIQSESFCGAISYARGGLANAWGAQLYPYTDADLAGFPLRAADLEPYYETLTDLIGICGQDDDLTPYYGPARSLLPPLELNTLGKDLLRVSSAQKEYLLRQGVRIGRPRLGVLSVKHRGRTPCDYRNMEFFHPRPPHVYTPTVTLEEMIDRRQLDYQPDHLALRYREHDDRVELETTNLRTGGREIFAAKRLVLAAGALGSAKLALASNNEFNRKLPLLDNPVSYIPFLNLFRLGAAQETQSFYTQLNLHYQGPLAAQAVMGTFYAVSGILHSDILLDMPLAFTANMRAAKYTIPATLVLHLWYPAAWPSENHLSLTQDNQLAISCHSQVDGELERHLIKTFRRFGLLSLPSLCRYPRPGSSYHFAGTLPMQSQPTAPYQTDPDGRLFGTKRIHVSDGACFPALPAKNLSFTIMANAMRIAEKITRELAAEA